MKKRSLLVYSILLGLFVILTGGFIQSCDPEEADKDNREKELLAQMQSMEEELARRADEFDTLPSDPCAFSDATIVSAESSKSREEDTFTYGMLWTVSACKKNVNIVIYLANDETDRLGITTDAVSKDETKENTATISLEKEFSQICVDTDDSALGVDGELCFIII